MVVGDEYVNRRGRDEAQEGQQDVADQAGEMHETLSSDPQADTSTGTGGKAVKITKFDSRIHGLCFAADDRSVFAVSELGGVHYDLWRIRLLEPGTSSRKITQGQADEDRPSVSKNGRWLLYTDNRNNATALVLRDLTDGSERTLSVNRLNFRKPAGRLELRTVDKTGNRPVTARVSIERK